MALRGFALAMTVAQVLERGCAVGHGDGGVGFVVVGDLVGIASLIGIKAAHLMRVDAMIKRLQYHLRDRLSQVVTSVAVDYAGLPILARDGDHEHGGMLRPGLVALLDDRQQLLKFGRVFFGSDDEAPGLQIAGGSRPAPRFQYAEQRSLVDAAFAVEPQRAPAMLDQALQPVRRRRQLLRWRSWRRWFGWRRRASVSEGVEDFGRDQPDKFALRRLAISYIHPRQAALLHRDVDAGQLAYHQAHIGVMADKHDFRAAAQVLG